MFTLCTYMHTDPYCVLNIQYTQSVNICILYSCILVKYVPREQTSVVDLKYIELDPNPDPELWSNLDPDQDPGLCYHFRKKQLKNFREQICLNFFLTISK